MTRTEYVASTHPSTCTCDACAFVRRTEVEVDEHVDAPDHRSEVAR